MRNKIAYLIESFIEKYNDEPNLVIIPSKMYKTQEDITRWRYAKLKPFILGKELTCNYENYIELNCITCDYIEEIQVLKQNKIGGF